MLCWLYNEVVSKQGGLICNRTRGLSNNKHFVWKKKIKIKISTLLVSVELLDQPQDGDVIIDQPWFRCMSNWSFPLINIKGESWVDNSSLQRESVDNYWMCQNGQVDSKGSRTGHLGWVETDSLFLKNKKTIHI